MKLRYLVFAFLFAAGCELTGTDDQATDDPGLALALPAPTGDYSVGTTSFAVTDTTRDDGYTQEIVDPRRLMVQLWYPTDAMTGETAPYISPGVAGILAATQDYLEAGEMLELVGDLQTNGRLNAPVAAGPHPVVFLSHGLTGVRALYTTFAEELASHGYVVVGTDHTYGALAVEFPDGSLRTIRTAGVPDFPDVVRIWAEDLSSVLTELERRNADDPDGLITGTLDLSRVGATGHSTGGSAAVQVHIGDSRFSAASSLDAPQVADAAEGDTGLAAPGMLFFASPSDYDAGLVQSRMTGPAYTVTVASTSHYSFTDIPVLLQIAQVPGEIAAASARPPGEIDPVTNLAIISGYTRAFFDRFLRGLDSELLQGAATWDEAEFRVLASP